MRWKFALSHALPASASTFQPFAWAIGVLMRLMAIAFLGYVLNYGHKLIYGELQLLRSYSVL